MKQHITLEQINELSGKGKEVLEDWTFNNIMMTKKAFIPLLSIGQMIEFLDESGEYSLLKVHSEVLGLPNNWGVGLFDNFNLRDGWVGNEYIIKYQENVELCDALWEAVKEAWEKNE